jgi:hypothetical protein
MIALVDLTGKKFGRWTVLEIGESIKGQRRWKCRCECGVFLDVMGGSLRSGLSKSCGCLSRELTRERLTVHGMTDDPLFKVWKGMLSRCSNQNGKGFKNYGGRGIKVCARWRDFQAFFADMSPGYVKGLTIERKDNDGDYSPDNCEWIAKSLQSKNRRSVRLIETPLGRMTIADAAKKAGASWFAIHNRVKKNWPIDLILSPPKGS